MAATSKRASRRTQRKQNLSPGDDNLGALILLVYGAVGAAFLIAAAHTPSPWRYILGAAGVLGVGIDVLAIGSLVLFGLGWGAFTGTFRAHPSVRQRIVWMLAAVGFGTVLGTATYAVGLPGLIDGPAVLIIVGAAVKLRPFDDETFIYRRAIAFFSIAAVVAVAVGLTIFL